jgi:hypothetical protein
VLEEIDQSDTMSLTQVIKSFQELRFQVIYPSDHENAVMLTWFFLALTTQQANLALDEETDENVVIKSRSRCTELDVPQGMVILRGTIFNIALLTNLAEVIELRLKSDKPLPDLHEVIFLKEIEDLRALFILEQCEVPPSLA